MSDDARDLTDEQLVLRDIRALLDQLQLDRDGALSMQSQLTDELGVDSLALVELCDQLERTFDVSLPDEVFLIATTPQQWLDAIEQARGGDSTVRDVEHSSNSTRRTLPSPRSKLTAVSKQVWTLATTRFGNRSPATTSLGSAPNAGGSILYALYAWVLLVPFALTIWLL